MHQGHQLVHSLAQSLFGAKIVQQRNHLGNEEEGIPIGGIMPASLQSGPDPGKDRLSGAGEHQVEGRGAGGGHGGKILQEAAHHRPEGLVGFHVGHVAAAGDRVEFGSEQLRRRSRGVDRNGVRLPV